MDDVEAVFLAYAGILYALHCVAVVPPWSAGFCATGRASYELLGPGLRITGFLPYHLFWLGRRLPFSLQDDGPALYFSRRFAPRHDGLLGKVPLTRVEPRGGAILLEGRILIDLKSELVAKRVCDFFQSLHGRGEPELRARFSEFLEESFSIRGAEERLRQVEARLLPVRILSSLLFFLVFIVIPASWSFVARPPVYAVVTMVYTAVVAVSWRTHRLLQPEAKASRIDLLFTLLSMPPSALRAPAALARDSCSAFDFRALASFLLERKAFTRLLRQELLEVRHPSWLDHRDRVEEERILGLAASRGISVEELERPEAWYDATATALCPYCEACYRAGFATCPDCRLTLIPCRVGADSLATEIGVPSPEETSALRSR